MITQTAYFNSTRDDVSRLANYLDKGWMMEDSSERAVDENRIDTFAAQAHRFGGSARMMTISPEDGKELDDGEMIDATHRTMREYIGTEGRYSLRYLAALHRDTDHDHVQMAIIGQSNDIEMDRDDLETFRELSLEKFTQEYEHQLIQEQLNGRPVDEVADDQISRIQTTLPGPQQLAEQLELDHAIQRLPDASQTNSAPQKSATPTFNEGLEP